MGALHSVRPPPPPASMVFLPFTNKFYLKLNILGSNYLFVVASYETKKALKRAHDSEG